MPGDVTAFEAAVADPAVIALGGQNGFNLTQPDIRKTASFGSAEIEIRQPALEQIRQLRTDRMPFPKQNPAMPLLEAVQFRLKDYPGADKQVQAILAAPATPAPLRQRALTMSQLLQPMVTSQ